VIVALGSIADAMMPVFVGWTVGMLSTTPPGSLFAEHGRTLALMLGLVLLRPLIFAADALARNHAITPNLIDLVRWQSHWHVIRQSWTFFQNDFAGRIGNRIMQAGDAVETTVNMTIDAVWYAAVFVFVAILVLARMDPVLLIPMSAWLALYALLLARSMPRIDRASEVLSEARSVMTGRMVDSYTNIQTLKTFALDGDEDAYVADAVNVHVSAFRRLMLIFTTSWSLLFLINAGLVISVTWLALAAWDAGTMSTAMVATAIPFVLQIMAISGRILEIGSTIFRQIGTARDSMETIAHPLTLTDAPEAGQLAVTRGEIVFDRVGFNYWRDDRTRLVRGFDLRVAPGEKIGLVGRSGAGKSKL
jgi:ATP-binding cassette subfamily B multidrug efflux pump